MLIKPATYDGTLSWLDYKSHFEACATLGHWTEGDKALYLAVSLRGQAQSVLGYLALGVLKNYDELITALNERYSPPNQMELHRAQLRERKQRAWDSLPELGQSIRRFTNLVYPTVLLDVREMSKRRYQKNISLMHWWTQIYACVLIKFTSDTQWRYSPGSRVRSFR